MHIFWNDPFTYIDQIEENPSFSYDDIKKRGVNIDTYLFKRFKGIKKPYIIKYQNEAILFNLSDPKHPQEIHFRKVTPEDKLEEIKDKYIWLDIPSLRFATTKDWIFHAFSTFKDRYIHAVISSTDLMKFPFFSVEINARIIAGFKEIILPNNRRIHVTKKKEIISNEKYLSSIGFTIEDVYNADIKKRIKINMESYKKAALFNQNPKKEERKVDKFKKEHKNYLRTVPDGKLQLSPEKRTEIAMAAVEGKKKEVTIKKLEVLCTQNKEFHHLIPYFKSRDIDLMLQALGEILSVDSQRYLRAVEHEQNSLEGALDSNVTQLSDNLFKHAHSLAQMLEPRLAPSPTYNILNYKVNVGMAVENLNNAGLSEQQRRDLAAEVDRIITEQKRARVTGPEVVIVEPTV